MPVPTDTPAGGLVRVVAMDGTNACLLDNSYPRGTAACTLETKLRWKLAPTESRGPPPFKGVEPSPPWSDKLAGLVAALRGAAYALAADGAGAGLATDPVAALAAAKATRDADLNRRKQLPDGDAEGFEGFMAQLGQALPAAARRLRDAVVAEDEQAVASTTAAIKAQA